MKTKTNRTRYYLYARKSTESDDKQIQSIEDQIDRLTSLGNELGLEIVEVFRESKSAKTPNNRPEFDKMLEKIESGKAEGILCWKLDRLSRNPIDSGRLQWMLQRNILQSIRTIERFYLPDDNVLIFNVETGMANQFIIDLRRNVKRGLESKVKKGWFASKAPVGYLNSRIKEKGEQDITIDTERFPLVREMFDLMLTGKYSVPQILDIVNKDWKFKTIRENRRGGKGLARTTLYKMFTNIFYTGLFEYKGVLYEGKHPSMISLDEYDKIQILLGRKGKQRPKERYFPFTNMIHCAECGAFITAITKTKLIKLTGKLKDYTYYFCTRNKKNTNCSQKKVVTAEDLEQQFRDIITSITLRSDFKERILQVLNKYNDKELHTRSNVYELQMESLMQTQRELDNLTKMHYKELITEQEYLNQRNELVTKIRQLKERIKETEQRAFNWLKITERLFTFATHAYEHFTIGNISTKRDILRALGQNYVLYNGKLNLQLFPYLAPIKETLSQCKTNTEMLEPLKTEKFDVSPASLAFVQDESLLWYPQGDLNPCYRRERAMS